MSEKPRGRLWRSPTNRRATSFRPISPSSDQSNPRLQRYSCPFRRSNFLGAARARFPSPLRRPPRSPREMPDPALSQLAWAYLKALEAVRPRQRLPRAAYGNLPGKLACLIGWHDDVYAGVGHRLTHLVLHAAPLDQELRENYAGGLFVLECEAPGAEVCGPLV